MEELLEEVQEEVKTNESILVDLEKIENLVNKVADLVITNSMLTQKIDNLHDEDDKKNIVDTSSLFERYIKELQDYAMELRMINIATLYEEYPQLVETTALEHEKKVLLKTLGETTKIEKSMIESITEPLNSIIKNAIEHGIEPPLTRAEKNKDETGLITISAEQINGQMSITILDDGKGIDLEQLGQKSLSKGLISEDELSAMNEHTKASLLLNEGSMLLVKQSIEKLNGTIVIQTEKDVGTSITIYIPLSLSILDGLNIRVGEEYFILPTTSIVESIQANDEIIKAVGDGSSELLMLREDFIPIVKLYEYLNLTPDTENITEGMLIVVKAGNEKVALFIDEFLHQQQVVVKPIDKNFKDVKGISGATVRGNGYIGLIIDVKSIIDDKEQITKEV